MAPRNPQMCRDSVKALPIPATSLQICMTSGNCGFRGGALCLRTMIDTSPMPIRKDSGKYAEGGKK